jgi:hypothetical protein
MGFPMGSELANELLLSDGSIPLTRLLKIEPKKEIIKGERQSSA